MLKITEKTPCKNGCIMCGFCCVAMTIDDEKLQKPAFKRCQHLRYSENRAYCAIHDERQPQTCRDYNPPERFKLLWFDDRLRYYRQREYMEHLAWMSQQGYVDHLPIFVALKNIDNSRFEEVYRYFIRPYLIAEPGTLAADKHWLVIWPGLIEYLCFSKGVISMARKEAHNPQKFRRSWRDLLTDTFSFFNFYIASRTEATGRKS